MAQFGIRTRFQLPVRYLVYSHSDLDHASGGEVFDDAIVVSHVQARSVLLGHPCITAPPTHTFSERMTIVLGGKKVNLVYLGKGHGENLLAVHSPDERAVLLVDIVFVNRLAYGAMGTYPTSPPTDFAEWLKGLSILESIDYDILLTGHGKAGSKSDGIEFRQYLQTLVEEVARALDMGMSLNQARESIELQQFRHMEIFEQWFKESLIYSGCSRLSFKIFRIKAWIARNSWLLRRSATQKLDILDTRFRIMNRSEVP